MSERKPYDAGNERDVRKAREQQRRETDEELNDLRHIMRDKAGRRFMWRLLSSCGVYQTSFTGNSETFFREGKRSIGLEHIDKLTRACLDEYNLMHTEALESKDHD